MTMMAAIMFLTCGNCPCNSVVITARVDYQSSDVQIYRIITTNMVALRQQMSMWRIGRLMVRFSSITRWISSGGISKEVEVEVVVGATAWETVFSVQLSPTKPE